MFFYFFMFVAEGLPPIMLYAMKTNTIHIIIGFGKHRTLPYPRCIHSLPIPCKTLFIHMTEHEIRFVFHPDRTHNHQS